MDDNLQGSLDLFDAAIDKLAEGMIVLDSTHHIRHINLAAQKLTGWTFQDGLGRRWSDVFAPTGGSDMHIAQRADGGPRPGCYEIILNSGAGALESRVTANVTPLAASPPGIVITLDAPTATARDELQIALDDVRRQLDITYNRGQVGFWEWDSRTRTLIESGYWVGKTLNTMTGCEVPDSVMLENTHPGDIQPVRAALIAHMKGETDHFEVEQRIRSADGGYIRFLVRGQAAECDAGGRVLRVAGTYVDITALHEQEAVLKFALENSQQGIWAWDAETDIVTELGRWQPHADRDELAPSMNTRTLFEHLHPDEIEAIRAQVLKHLRGDTESIELEARMRRRDGSWGDYLIRGQAIDRREDGWVSRIIGAYTEVSAMKTQERRLQVALENGRQGLWEWEPRDDRVFFSREWYAMFGYPPGSISSARNDTPRIIHADDMAPTLASIVPMLRGQRDDFEIEHRIRHITGRYINILARGKVTERDGSGLVTRVIGTHVDITKLKNTEARLIDSRRLLETVIDAFPQRVFWKDLDDRYLGCNRLFARDAGFTSPAELVGKRLDDLPWPGPTQPLHDDDRRLLEGEEPKIIVRRQFQPVASPQMWVETTKVPIHAPNGEIMGILGLYDDVSERMVREQQMETVAAAFTRPDRARLLDALTEAAAILSGADYAFVARVEGPDNRFARVTASFPANAGLFDWCYEIVDTPCYRTARDGECYIPERVTDQFPDDPELSHWGIEAYAGQRLMAEDGETFGLFVLLFRSPQPDVARIRTVMDIFAARATAELEREHTVGILRASEQRLNAAIEGGTQGIWEWTQQSDRINLLGAAFYVDGRGIEREVIRDTGELIEILHPDDRERQRNAIAGYFGGRTPLYEFEGRIRVAEDEYRWMLIRGQAAKRDENNHITELIGTLTDISQLKRVQSELETSQQFLNLVVDTVPQAIFWQDRAYRYLGCNQQFADFCDVAGPHAVIGAGDQQLWWGAHAARFRREDEALLDGTLKALHTEMELERPGADPAWFELVKVPMRDNDGRIIGLLGAIHDITVRKQAEQAAQHLARFDPLTNLPNRRYFAERLESALASASRRDNMGALLFIDIDQFKHVNDTLGHSVGDGLLRAISERLENVTRQDDTVARLGGDEFVVLLPEIANDLDSCARQAKFVADKINASLGLPFQLDHHQFHITPTIGISLFPEPGKSVDDVLKEADTAMYSGKAAGRNVTRFFRREMEEVTRQRLRIESDLRQAIERDEFELYYQPQVDRSGDVTGAEALLRWRHSEHGLIPPAEFIPVAEERGLIVEIGRWVLDASFGRFKAWMDNGIDLDELAINLSSRQFRSHDFVGEVERLLAVHRIPAHRVVFEITESTVVEDVEATIAIMTRLRRVGIRFAIDDFGVGYSSLSYLKRLPIDQLKIDRSFVTDIGRDQNNEVICQTIIAMSQHLRLQTIAEGVETEEQCEFLSRLRCNGYQGFLFLPPSREKDFLRYCRTQQPV